ncbi:MAG: thiocyanate hydrolase [Mycobacterium sp.]
MPDEHDVATVRVQTLEQIAKRGQVWARMAEKYGVSNPVPPWKSSLDGMCDALDREGEALSLLTRRQDEDRLSHGVYATLPYPENQLVALTHSLVARKVIDEAALAERMKAVRARLEGAIPFLPTNHLITWR